MSWKTNIDDFKNRLKKKNYRDVVHISVSFVIFFIEKLTKRYTYKFTQAIRLQIFCLIFGHPFHQLGRKKKKH